MIFKNPPSDHNKVRQCGKAAKINFLKKYNLKIKTPTERSGAHHMLIKELSLFDFFQYCNIS